MSGVRVFPLAKRKKRLVMHGLSRLRNSSATSDEMGRSGTVEARHV